MKKYLYLYRAPGKGYGYVAVYFDGPEETHRASTTLAIIDRLSDGKKRKPKNRIRCKDNQRWAQVLDGKLVPISDAAAPVDKVD
jgi:hypothetical protein